MTDVTEPNLFELACAGIRVTYSTSSFQGSPQFSFHDADHDLTASGDDIRTRASELGIEVTATLETVPDARTVTLTLLVPHTNLGDGREAAVSTSLIETTNRTSIGGPHLVMGQVQTYRTTELHGTAKLVDF